MLMTGECKREKRSKVKIDKWLGETNLKVYEQFIMQWKDVLDQTREILSETTDSEEQKKITMSLLQKYYLTPYKEKFFEDFGERT